MKRKRSNLPAKKPIKRLPLIQNPPLAVDFVSFVGPGFLAFVATKTITRGVTTLVAKKYPGMPVQFQKHVKVASAVAAFAGAYYGAHRVQKLEAYHTPIVVGAAMAMAQTVLHTYLPGLRWLLSDSAEATQPALSGTAGPKLRARPTAAPESDAASYMPAEPGATTTASTVEAEAPFGTTFGDSNLWGEASPDDVLDQMVS